MTKNSKEAIPLFAYLNQMGEPLEGMLAEHLRDYQFPRDFSAIEELGASGSDHYLGQGYKKDLFEAVGLGLKDFQKGTPEAMEYELRGLRMASIEFRNHTATEQFVTYVMELYEGGWERRAFLKDFLQKNPLPRVQAFIKAESQPESGNNAGTEEESGSDSFEDVLSAHLYLAARFALTPDRANLIQVLKDFSNEHSLELLKPLMHDLTLVHARIEAILNLLGDDFSDLYVQMQTATMNVTKGEENYYAVLIAVLEGKCKLDSPIFNDYGSLVALTMAAMLYGADVEYVESMIEMINLDHLPPIAAKQLGRLLQNCGYERYALAVYARGNLYDVEVLSAMLNLGFSGNHVPEDVIVALTARVDFNPETPIDLKVIIADLLQSNILPDGTYPSEMLAMFGEIAIAYGEVRNGLSILRDAAKTGNLRAKTRIAEYYLYQAPKPKKALELFQELHALTQDPKYLADIARARKLLMEKASAKHPETQPYDASKLLESIKDLPEDHPEYLETFLEFSVTGNTEVFDKGCRALMFSNPAQIDSLPESIFEQYDIRIIDEIDRIEAKTQVDWADISRHLFYSRTLAGVHSDDIEFTLDYLNDLLKYMDDFRINDTVHTEKKLNETSEQRRVSLRNAVFGQFLRQFTESSFAGESEEFIYSLMDYDDNGNEIGMLDQIVDPFVIAVIFEIGFFEQRHMGNKKMPKFYEFAAEIFEAVCNHPILAQRYEQKGRNIVQYIKNSKKPKFVDPAVQNSPTLLQ